MRNTATLIGAGLLAIGLTACTTITSSTVTATRLNVNTADSATFNLADERPAHRRVSSANSHRFGSTVIFGDDAISPSPLALTKTWLSKARSEWIHNTAVTLREFSVQVSLPNATIDESRFQAAIGATPGGYSVETLARALITSIESVRTPKSVTVTIVINAGGRDYSYTDGRSYQGRITEQDINTVITGTLDGLLKAMEKPPIDAASQHT